VETGLGIWLPEPDRSGPVLADWVLASQSVNPAQRQPEEPGEQFQRLKRPES